MDKKAIFGLILCLGALLLMSISYSLPWYQVRIDSAQDEMHIDVYFDYSEVKVIEDGEEYLETDDLEYQPAIKTVLNNTRGIFLIGLFILIIGMAFIVLKTLDKVNKNTATFVLILGALFLLLAPIYFMCALPPAIGEDFETSGSSHVLPVEGMSKQFSGSNEQESVWGGGPGWYLVFIAAGMTVASAISLFVSRNRVMDAPIGRAELRRSTQLGASEQEPETSEPTYEGKNTVFEDDEGWIRY